MMLLAVGCNYRTTPVELRERLAFDAAKLEKALTELSSRYGWDAVILSTCNRVELYLGRLAAPAPLDADLLAEFLSEMHGLPPGQIRPHLYEHRQGAAVQHLFRVAASLDSLVIGEGQVAGQVKQAYEFAQTCGTAGPVLHALFQHARVVSKRVRTETGIAQGHVSVSSVAVDYVRQVFDHFGDKTILVIGAGKMSELTLKHLRHLKPKRIVVTNRSLDRAAALAQSCGGEAVPWEKLDDVLARADIVLSSTGAPEPIVTRKRWDRVQARRAGGPVVILDIAVPRDFDPAIHDGDLTCLFNIDDLQRIREQTLRDRFKHVAPAEAIVAQEQQRFLKEWTRKLNGPLIAQLTQDLDAKRQAIVGKVLSRFNGKLNAADKAYLEGAFRLLQNQFLHGPISALAEEGHDEPSGHGKHTLRDALRKLFGLQD